MTWTDVHRDIHELRSLRWFEALEQDTLLSIARLRERVARAYDRAGAHGQALRIQVCGELVVAAIDPETGELAHDDAYELYEGRGMCRVAGCPICGGPRRSGAKLSGLIESASSPMSVLLDLPRHRGPRGTVSRVKWAKKLFAKLWRSRAWGDYVAGAHAATELVYDAGVRAPHVHFHVTAEPHSPELIGDEDRALERLQATWARIGGGQLTVSPLIVDEEHPAKAWARYVSKGPVAGLGNDPVPHHLHADDEALDDLVQLFLAKHRWQRTCGAWRNVDSREALGRSRVGWGGYRRPAAGVTTVAEALRRNRRAGTRLPPSAKVWVPVDAVPQHRVT